MKFKGKNKFEKLKKRNKKKNGIRNFFIFKIVIVICILYSVRYILNSNMLLKGDFYEQSSNLSKPQLEFIKSLEESAKSNYKKYNIYPSITIAQAIIESGWGKSDLTKKSNNLFGIKADQKWNGDTVEVMTSENYNDSVSCKFRKYKSIEESIYDYGEFLKQNSRYEKQGLFDANNYKEQAQALEDAGYSTKKDKNGNLIYADIIIDLIENYKLNLID